ncbi:MAG: hydrogenase expression/formation protein HypC [Solirubrobacteraceae bacterium]|jgi:hydrogenase maturation factor|nr:hydrogenase expression/formation protein HypC [Solirubrobacteraceae bacterium]
MTRDCDDPHHCVTCSDEGVAMRVLAVDEPRGLALCQGADGARTSVEVALVGAVAPGDALLVHAGTALTLLDAEAIA